MIINEEFDARRPLELMESKVDTFILASFLKRVLVSLGTVLHVLRTRVRCMVSVACE